MNDKIKCRLLIIGLLIVFVTACSVAQNGFDTNLFKTRNEIKILEQKTIVLDLQLKVNNKEIIDTVYTIDIVNLNTGQLTTLHMSNKFILYLDYNMLFEISISYNNKTNIKAILIDTHAPNNDWYIITGINLDTHNANKKYLVGGLKYDEERQTFIKYKI